MSDVKIDETTNEIHTENGDRDDGSVANSVSDGEIIEDDELEDSSLPALTSATKVPKNFRSRNDRSDSEDETETAAVKGASATDPRLRPNGAAPLSKHELERLRRERKDIIDELGRRDVTNDRKPARHSLDMNRAPQRNNNDARSGFRRSLNDQNRRNNIRDRPSNFRAHPQQQDNNARQPNSDELRVNGISGTIFFPKNMIKYTKASPSISYSQNPNPRERKRFNNFDKQKSRVTLKSRKSRSRSRSLPKHDRKSDKVKKSPLKHSRESDKSSPTKLKSKQASEKPVEEKIEEKKTESLQVDDKTDDVDDENGSTTPPLFTANIDSEKSISDCVEKEKSPDPESLSKEIESIFETSKFPKIEMKIERRKSPKKLEKPRVNIFLEDSDEVDEFENTTTFEVKSRWTTPPRVEPTADKTESLKLLPSKVIDSKKLKDPAMPVVVESPERSPIITSIDNIFTIAKSPSPPPKPKPNVRNVCSFLSDIASGNFLSDFLNDDNEKLGGLSSFKKSDGKVVDNHVEPDTTVVKALDKNSDDDSDDSSSDSDDSDSDDSSSSSSSDTTTSESEEEAEESSEEEESIQSGFSGFGTFSSSSMPMVQHIRPISTPSTPASITPTHVPPIVSAIRPGIIPVMKPSLFTPSPIKSLQANPISQSPFMPSPAISGIPGIPGIPTLPGGIPAFPFKIYSLRDMAVFTPPVTPPSTVSTPSTPANEKIRDDKERTSDKRDRERKRSRSRSASRERDRKRTKDDRRKSPARRKSPSPVRKRHVEDKRESRRRDDDRKRDTHRSSPIRKRKSRSKTPPKNRSPIRRSKSPPRPRTPPPKRRSSPHRRSVSRSPPAKHRRSVSPIVKRGRSPSPAHRRSPRRSRHSRSPNRRRRTPSPNLRYERRSSYSPTFRGKMESPSLYKPDSTISDTELERQQQMHNEDFYGQWSNQNSPKRPNLDDRINNILTDSPSYQHQQEQQRQQQYSGYPEFAYDNQQMFQNDMYGMYDEYGNYVSSRNYVNNSNLVEITQQKREKQRMDSSQVAVQVGNCLQIVPTKVVPVQEVEKSKLISTAEKRAEAKAKRKVKRDRKRQDKVARKEKLRQEIQRYFNAGITADNSDNEELIPLRSVNITAVAERGILKKVKNETKNERRVLFKDGILPGESTSDEEMEQDQNRLMKKLRREKFRKKRLSKIRKGHTFNGKEEPCDIYNDTDTENQPPPNAPPDSPPSNLPQPKLKKITPEMFAAFPVDPAPMYYYIEQLKVQMSHANGYQYQQNTPRGQNERFNYYKKFAPPPSLNLPPQQQQHPGQFQNHSHQPHYHHHHHPQQYNNNHHQRNNMMPPRSSQNNSVSSLDPRINQQRAAEKTFA